jgi:hypothetical protein
MSDVITVAKNKRARIMAEIERLMAEAEELENFINFGRKLSASDVTAAQKIAAE